MVKVSFFNKIDNYLIVNAIKEILKRGDPEESMWNSVEVGIFQKYVLNSEWKVTRLAGW